MNNKQYNNIIEYTLKHNQTEDTLTTVKTILNNMGIALPNGDIKTVYETIKSGDYMGWRACTMQEAQQAANNGIAAIGISEDRIVVVMAKDDESDTSVTETIKAFSENIIDYSVVDLKYYTYAYGSTNNNSGNGTISWVEDYDAIYVSLYGEDGLEIVGHAYVFLKNAYNNWIKTEFNTPGGNNLVDSKLNAKIYVERNFTSEQVQYILTKGTRDLVMSEGYCTGIYTKGLEFFPIAGIFSSSIELAEKYEGSNFGGYNLLTNNCLHYVKKLLRAGYAYDYKIENVLEKSGEIEPKRFIRELFNAV